MASRRSTYVFPTEQDFEDAKDHIYRAMYRDWNNSDAIYFYGYWGGCSRFDWEQCWKAEIWSDCSDPTMVADIFREHRGRYYDE